jgi:hypothetical protein
MLNRENAASKLKQEHGGDRIRVEDAIIAWHPYKAFPKEKRIEKASL